MNLNEKVRNLDVWDIGLTKLSVVGAVFFFISIWTDLGEWIIGSQWWIWIILVTILSARPMYKFFKKSDSI